MSTEPVCVEFRENVLPTLYGKPTEVYRYICLALGIISFLYYVVGMFLFLYYRKSMLRLRSRSVYMSCSLAICLLIFNVVVYAREFVGREYFQCRAIVWTTYLTLTFGSGSYLGNLFNYIYKLRMQRDQGLHIIDQNKKGKRIPDAAVQDEATAADTKKPKSPLSFCSFVFDYLSVLKYSKNGRIYIQGYEEKEDNVSANGSESVAGSSLYVFSSDSQGGDTQWTLWDRVKEEFIRPTFVLMLFGSIIIICALIRINLDPLFFYSCEGCFLTWIDYTILGLCLAINAITICIGLYAIRNEADPLGVMVEAKVSGLCCAVGAPICVIQVLDPGHVYMDYKFTWDILFSFFSCVLYFPTIYSHLINSYKESRTKRRAGTGSISTYNEKRVGTSPQNNNNYSSENLPPAYLLDVNLIIQDPRARNALLEHTVNELSSENLVFVFKVRAWKALWEKEQSSKVNKIAINLYNEHISRSGKAQINISNALLARVEKSMSLYLDTSSSIISKSGNITPMVSNKIPLHIFDECEHECIHILKTDTLPRFRNSQLFRERIIDSGILGKIMPI